MAERTLFHYDKFYKPLLEYYKLLWPVLVSNKLLNFLDHISHLTDT